MEELFRSGSIDQNRSSVNWPLAKALQRHGDAETSRLGLIIRTTRHHRDRTKVMCRRAGAAGLIRVVVIIIF
jgi:hypothetical protein